MALRYPPQWLAELRARCDIVDVVSAYVPLKKNGKKYWGLCPFHQEKTASFSVDQEQQLYYCFGCKAGGTVIQFVMDIERLDFGEAVKLLAERAHMTVPELQSDPDYERRRTERDRLKMANTAAARFFHSYLFKAGGEPVLSYLKGRGLDDAVIRRFGMGASPDNWDTLYRHLLSQGFTEKEIILAGLAVEKPEEYNAQGERIKPRRVFDMFRNRAMFPILDTYGNVLAFGGRTIGAEQPKYLNTSDTPIFNKRQGVFAANLLRKERGLKRVILVEGYMDVVALNQFGVRGVCATLGTALTAEQARLLKRFAPMVYLSYDGDSAGQHAILRGLDILALEQVEARVLDFPEGLDPDEFMRKHGPEAFEKLPALRPEVYRMRRLREQFPMDSQEGRTAYARACAPYLKSLDPLELENRLQELAVQTGFSREVLLQQIQQSSPPQAASAQASKPANRSKTPEDGGATVEEMLLSIASRLPDVFAIIQKEDFQDPVLKEIYVQLSTGISVQTILEEQEDDQLRAKLSRIFAQHTGMDDSELLSVARDCLHRIDLERNAAKIESIKAMLPGLPSEEKAQAMKELTLLMSKQKELQTRKNT